MKVLLYDKAFLCLSLHSIDALQQSDVKQELFVTSYIFMHFTEKLDYLDAKTCARKAFFLMCCVMNLGIWRMLSNWRNAPLEDDLRNFYTTHHIKHHIFMAPIVNYFYRIFTF